MRGTPSDAGPSACPFVALELDRDRRSERPDYRHRCYAEQVPAPRTIAHQERYCLSPNFSGCPIFQDWAVRAAARAVPLPQGHEGRRAIPDPRPTAEPGTLPERDADVVWPDSMATPLPTDAEVAASDESAGTQQLSAFDAPPALATPPETEEPGDWERAAAGLPRRDHGPAQDVAQDVAQDIAAQDEAEEVDAAPVPAFLVGRSSRPRSSSAEGRASREDVVPSWEITDRYGAQSGGEPRGGDGTFRRLLTMAAVVIILGLGIAAVIMVPGLLAGSPPSSTRPSLNVPSRAPTPAASGVSVIPTAAGPTIAPTTVGPTTAATPAPSLRPYRIKSGDTLARIAKRFDTTVADILAANPHIPDANHIEVGQVIVIPLPPATPAP